MRWRIDSPARRGWLGVVVLSAVLGMGCSGAESPGPDIVLGDAFVEVPRQLSSAQHSTVTRKLEGVVSAAEKTFYLAIRRNELQHRWFLFSRLRESLHEPATFGLPSHLTPRVIRFQEQNGKLFLFDARDGLVRGDLFKAESLVEAFPIVTDHAAFNRLPGSDQYVLFDPAAGLNRFGVVGDGYYGAGAVDFRVELLFSQRFRRISEGIQFQQVFTGYSTIPGQNGAGELPEDNAFRFSGTLSLALRKYQEGEGFTPMHPPEESHFFLSEGRFIPNTGEVERMVARWNIHPGMKPIRWYITPSFDSLREDPRYQQADIVGAVRQGIEGWNRAFGFKVFETALTDDSMDIGDHDKNIAFFDPDLMTPGAIADFTANPNTGEMRGANISITAGMIHDAEAFYSGAQAARAVPALPAPALRLSWSGLTRQRSCELGSAELLLAAESAQASQPADRAGALELAPWQKVERYITYIVLHEVGHTLGLRHNFNGSRSYDGAPGAPRTSTVMDYANLLDAYQVLEPGTYDVAAVRYLSGLSSELPSDSFCTDPVVRNWDDPNCGLYDRFDAPLPRWYAPNTRPMVGQMLRGARESSAFNSNLFRLDAYLRNGDAGEQLEAYDVLMEQVRPPLQVPEGQGAAYAARADALARRLLGYLYVTPRSYGDVHRQYPIPATPEYTQALLADVRGILLNVDGVRGFPSRRVMVDVLKAHQTLAAYGVLEEAHAELTARLPTLSGDERLGTKELLSRIELASAPYFR
ncbi:zinc-dependent metalloprotease [Myxococcus landrumensis]|uniref:Zinc-dependent metalloprotease n=1 Tax=Myxococcus landrumensis TaxID=2813577 RepID=A0ABX7MZ17_9BACT|nr:zinc-dependent metalloprotease [Myxococcus landrumus]QSQ11682.1 zinc-dependent metalloprotease [Myxococcus landrumus]